jgi:hypothetical protein
MTDKALANIEELIAAFYGAFDNRASHALKISELIAMFTPHARISRTTPNGVDEWTVEEFVAPRATLLTDGSLEDFHEWEVEAKTLVSGNIASRFSRYQKQGVLKGAPYTGGGVKFIQLCHGREGWKISSILWEDA